MPHVAALPLTPRDQCLILASDGLWDVVTDAEAVKAVCDIARGAAGRAAPRRLHGRGRGGPAAPGSRGRLGPPAGSADVSLLMRPIPAGLRPIAAGCGGAGKPPPPDAKSSAGCGGFIGFVPMEGGTIPLGSNTLGLIKQVLSLVKTTRCKKNPLEYDPDKFRPGMCGWRCSFLQQTNCIPRCVQTYACCSMVECLTPRVERGDAMYAAMKACQFEDCRVQMWGCEKQRDTPDPRGNDPTYSPYSVLDTGKNGYDRKIALKGPDPAKAFNPTAKMPDVSDRLFRFWKYPVEIEPQVFGAKGLLDEGLFPYPTYRMLGGMPFQKIEVQ